jgi:hypothetical protein
VTRHSAESWSVIRRFTSSGMVMSKLRSPASTWATGMCSLAATRAAAIVEFTSPYTMTSAGERLVNSRSSPIMSAAVCSACPPEPTPRLTSGTGSPSSSKKISDIRAS